MFFKKGTDINSPLLNEISRGQLIDVRSKAEWDSGHLPTAVHVPVEQLVENVEKFTKDKDATYYIYCLSGGRAGQAVRALKSKNIDAENLGGIWQYKGALVK